jgi:TetR/AcrR family transcriptional regulator, transcriptional repressor for nem operon
MRGQETREMIVAKADDLFYRQGFDATAFADIAQSVGISRGNFYYHFRTKDDILASVIGKRLADRRRLLAGWAAENSDPAERICLFINILITNRDKIMDHGCPVGTLCNELAKLNHQAQPEARAIFELFRDWLVEQFTALGRDDGPELALDVLGFSQGVAVLSTAFRDTDYVAREVDKKCAWVRGLKQGN